jgi:peptide deformylase
MAVREILLMGDPRLLEIANPVEAFDTPELHALVQDLVDTMHAEDGAGLAAPQIGAGLRVVVFGFDSNPRYPDEESVPQTVLVNPVIEPLSDDRNEGWEGCLSVPGLRGAVSRYTHIRYSGADQTGATIEREAHGFHARVVQHECDHLDGILYPQRMTDMRLFGFNQALEASGHLTAMPCDTQPEQGPTES